MPYLRIVGIPNASGNGQTKRNVHIRAQKADSMKTSHFDNFRQHQRLTRCPNEAGCERLSIYAADSAPIEHFQRLNPASMLLLY